MKINKEKEQKLDWNYLYDILDYNEDTGIFKYKLSRGNKSKNSIAGTFLSDGYIQIIIKGNAYQAHRLAWFYINAEWPKELIDHKDGNKANNAISNLRECNNSQNQGNRKISKGSSKYKGVSFVKDRNKWQAYIILNSKQKHLGNFNNEIEAAKTYNKAAIKYHEDFAKINMFD